MLEESLLKCHTNHICDSLETGSWAIPFEYVYVHGAKCTSNTLTRARAATLSSSHISVVTDTVANLAASVRRYTLATVASEWPDFRRGATWASTSAANWGKVSWENCRMRAPSLSVSEPLPADRSPRDGLEPL